MISPLKRLKAVNWNTPRKRHCYATAAVIALAVLCGAGNALQSAAHQNWHQVLKETIVALQPYATALLKVVLVFFIASLSCDKATAFVTRVAGRLPSHNTFKAAITNNFHIIHWTIATVVAVYVVDKMLMAYVFVVLYAGYKLLSKYVDDMAAGFALVSTAKVKVGSQVTIEKDVTGTLLEVALFYSSVQIGNRVRKVQNNTLWQTWLETDEPA
jgi:hypothetical protein